MIIPRAFDSALRKSSCPGGGTVVLLFPVLTPPACRLPRSFTQNFAASLLALPKPHMPKSQLRAPHRQPCLAGMKISGVSRKRKVIVAGASFVWRTHLLVTAFITYKSALHGDVLSIWAAGTGTLQSSHAGYMLVLCLPVYRPFTSSLLAFCLPSPP